MRHQGFIVKTVRQRPHHDGRPVAVIVRVAFDIAGETQCFQYSIGRGARQTYGGGEGIDGRQLEAVEFGQDLESAIQGTDRPGRITGNLFVRCRSLVRMRGNLCVHHPNILEA